MVVVDLWEVIVMEKTRLENPWIWLRRSAADVQIGLRARVGRG